MKASRILGLAVGAGALLALVPSCRDPELEREVDAQGNEVERVPVGAFHRAGKQCVVCHQEGGEADGSPFTVAGTIFASAQRDVGVSGAQILLTDADGSKYVATTNCVGNFFVRPAEWLPRYPILVAVEKNGVRREMASTIGRSADCASCHKVAATNPLAELDHVYLFGANEPNLPDGDRTCPVDPVRPGTK